MLMYKYLFTPLNRPREKHWIGGMLAAIGSIGAAGINYAATSMTNSQKGSKFYEQNDYNLGVMREQQRWQEGMTNLQYERQNELIDKEYSENRRLIAEQRAYDSPSAQVQRAAAAGLNPSAVLGSSAGAVGSGSFGVPAMPEPASSPASIPSAQAASTPDYQSPFDGSTISGLANLVSTLVQAKKHLAQGEKESRTIEPFVSFMENQAAEKEIQVRASAIDLTIKKETGLKKAWTEVNEVYTRSILNEAMARDYDRNEFVQHMDAFLKSCDAKLKLDEANKVRTEVSQMIPMFAVQLDNARKYGESLRAQTAESYASAGLKRVQSKVEDLHKQLLTKENAIKSQTFQDDLDTAFLEVEQRNILSQEQIEHGKFLLQSARAANNLPDGIKKTRWFLEWLSQVAGTTLGGAAGAYVGARLGRGRSSKSSGSGFSPYSSPNYTYGE